MMTGNSIHLDLNEFTEKFHALAPGQPVVYATDGLLAQDRIKWNPSSAPDLNQVARAAMELSDCGKAILMQKKLGEGAYEYRAYKSVNGHAA